MTDGFDVFVQDVMAAMTTAPCRSSNSDPSNETATPVLAAAGLALALAPTAAPAVALGIICMV